MATLHAQALNEAQHARAWVASLERECERLRTLFHRELVEKMFH